MKSLLRSSILALIVAAGFAAFSTSSAPAAIPGSTQGCGGSKPGNVSFCVQ